MDKTVLMLVIAALLLGVLPAGILGYSWWVEAWVRVQDCDIVQDFRHVQTAMCSYAKRHGRRAGSLSDLDFGISEEGIVDPRTGGPYVDLLDKNVYVYDRKKKVLRKACVMSSVCRTKAWPYGKRQRIVLYRHDGSLASGMFDERQIMELSSEYQVIKKGSEEE